jgi:hypothetical protein
MLEFMPVQVLSIFPALFWIEPGSALYRDRLRHVRTCVASRGF